MYVVGTIIIVAAVPLFLPPIGLNVNECIKQLNKNVSDTNTATTNNLECTNKEQALVTAYYSAFSALWGIGWASIEISHLSMLPVLAHSENSRMTLNSINYASYIISIICLYGSSWLFIRTGEDVLYLRSVGAIFTSLYKFCSRKVINLVMSIFGSF